MPRLVIPLSNLRRRIILAPLNRLLVRRRPVISDTKQLIHVLERDALGLGHEEPDKDEHAEAEAAKDQIGAVAVGTDGDQHGGHGAGDDEVEEPLGGGGVRDVERAQAGGGNLRGVDPAGGTPAELEETVFFWLNVRNQNGQEEMGKGGGREREGAKKRTYAANKKMHTNAK